MLVGEDEAVGGCGKRPDSKTHPIHRIPLLIQTDPLGSTLDSSQNIDAEPLLQAVSGSSDGGVSKIVPYPKIETQNNLLIPLTNTSSSIPQFRSPSAVHSNKSGGVRTTQQLLPGDSITIREVGPSPPDSTETSPRSIRRPHPLPSAIRMETDAENQAHQLANQTSHHVSITSANHLPSSPASFTGPTKIIPLSPNYPTSDLGSSPRSSISVTTCSSSWSGFRDSKISSSDCDSDLGKDLLSPGVMLSPAPFSPFSDCDLPEIAGGRSGFGSIGGGLVCSSSGNGGAGGGFTGSGLSPLVGGKPPFHHFSFDSIIRTQANLSSSSHSPVTSPSHHIPSSLSSSTNIKNHLPPYPTTSIGHLGFLPPGDASALNIPPISHTGMISLQPPRHSFPRSPSIPTRPTSQQPVNANNPLHHHLTAANNLIIRGRSKSDSDSFREINRLSNPVAEGRTPVPSANWWPGEVGGRNRGEGQRLLSCPSSLPPRLSPPSTSPLTSARGRSIHRNFGNRSGPKKPKTALMEKYHHDEEKRKKKILEEEIEIRNLAISEPSSQSTDVQMEDATAAGRGGPMNELGLASNIEFQTEGSVEGKLESQVKATNFSLPSDVKDGFLEEEPEITTGTLTIADTRSLLTITTTVLTTMVTPSVSTVVHRPIPQHPIPPPTIMSSSIYSTSRQKKSHQFPNNLSSSAFFPAKEGPSQPEMNAWIQQQLSAYKQAGIGREEEKVRKTDGGRVCSTRENSKTESVSPSSLPVSSNCPHSPQPLFVRNSDQSPFPFPHLSSSTAFPFIGGSRLQPTSASPQMIGTENDTVTGCRRVSNAAANLIISPPSVSTHSPPPLITLPSSSEPSSFSREIPSLASSPSSATNSRTTGLPYSSSNLSVSPSSSISTSAPFVTTSPTKKNILGRRKSARQKGPDSFSPLEHRIRASDHTLCSLGQVSIHPNEESDDSTELETKELSLSAMQSLYAGCAKLPVSHNTSSGVSAPSLKHQQQPAPGPFKPSQTWRRSSSESDATSRRASALECHHCGQGFTVSDRLVKHMASRHQDRSASVAVAPDDNQPSTSSVAEESPTPQSAFTSSSSSTKKAYKCLVCPKSFGRSDMLTRHMRLHTGFKPYACRLCRQVFSRSDHLTTHQRTHTGEKPYQCPQCSYAASRRDMITRHMRTHIRPGDPVGPIPPIKLNPNLLGPAAFLASSKRSKKATMPVGNRPENDKKVEAVDQTKRSSTKSD